MKRLLVSLICLSVLAVAQTTTPNIGLNVPVVGQINWGASVNNNWTLIDSLLSGHTAIPSLVVSGTATFNGPVQINGTCTGNCGGGGGGTITSVFGRPGPAITAQSADYNISQITNGVSTAGSYSDPSWLTSLSWGKLTGNPTVNGHSLTSNVSLSAGDVGSWDLSNNNAIGAHYFDITGITAPGNPAASTYRYYSKTGTGLCQKDSGGTETCFSSGAGGAVSSVSGDGSLFTNSGSTSAVTLTLGNALAHRFWGNNTGSTGVPAYVQPACGDLSNAATSCSIDATNASNIASGTLPNARLSAIPNGSLANSSITINGQTPSLGGTANIPFQTAGVNNTSLAGVNFVASTTNAAGLTVTPVNSATNQEKFEITGASYTGNAATASAFQSAPTPCGAGNSPTGVDVHGNSINCFAPLINPMNTVGQMVGGGTSGAVVAIPAGLTGQALVATNSATPAFASPGIAGRTATLATDNILCDSGTAIQDRGELITYNRGTAVAVTVPDAGSSGCGGNFFFGVQNLGAGLVTFNRTTSSTFTTFNGSAVTSGATSFTLAQGQFAIVSSLDNSTYVVRLTTGGAGGGVTSFTGDGAFITNSGSTGAVTTTLGNAAAHAYWGNNTGSTAAPGYHVLAAADLPSTLTSGTAITNAALTTPNLGTPSAATLTNATGLPLSTGVTGTLQAAQMPALTGDVTNSTGSLTTSVVGLHFGASAVTLGTVPASGQCLVNNAGVINGTACSGGTISGLTTGAIVTAASATSVQTPSTTATMDASGNISTPGTITSTASSGITAKKLTFNGSTSGSAAISVPAAAGTPSTILLPSTDPTNGQVLSAGTPGGGNVQLSWINGGGTGTVTSVSSSAPLSGSGTTTVALSCPTCVTSAAALTSNAVVIGGGSQASSTISADTTTTHALFATAGAPAFRALAAGDLPAALSSSTSINGTTIPASGNLFTMGTPAAGGIAYGASTTQYSTTSAGTARQLVLSGGTSAPTFTDFPDVKIIPAANCVNGTAGSGWSSTSTGFTGTCRAGTNNFNGVLNAVPSTGATAYLDFELPGDWDSASLPYVQIYYASGANTSGTVIWTVSHACTKNDGSVTDDPAWIAESAMGTQTMAAANRMWAQNAQFAGSMTNCVAGGTMYLKLVLSGTASSAIQVSKATVTINRLLVSAAN